MNYNNLIVNVKDNIAEIILNRPDKLNALNDETFDELNHIFTEIKNDETVFTVIITGAGEKAFAAGADILELNKCGVVEGKRFSEKGQAVFNLIENLGKPVIAAVNGYALGGGCELAMACHIRYASVNAKFGQPEVNLGIIPGYGGTQRLARLINTGRAAEFLLTGDIFDAEEAYRLGLANKIFPSEELQAKTWELAVKIASKGQIAVAMALKSVVSVNELSEKEGLNFESSNFAICCGTEDFKEGTSAFLEKRKPEFKNR